MEVRILIVEISFHFSLPTDIQQEGIPAILGGGDVLMVDFPAFIRISLFFRLPRLEVERRVHFVCRLFRLYGRQCAISNLESTSRWRVNGVANILNLFLF